MDGNGEDLFLSEQWSYFTGILQYTWHVAVIFHVKELATFRKLNSRLQGHPTTHEHLPGIRVASGSLGQGMSVAIGAALAKKLNNDNQYCLFIAW